MPTLPMNPVSPSRREPAGDEAGMHRVGGHARAVEPAGELAREQHVHQLRAPVGAERAVLARRLEVVELQAAGREAVRVRGDHHDACRRARDELVAQQVRQQEVAEVVGLELGLVPVLGHVRAA